MIFAQDATLVERALEIAVQVGEGIARAKKDARLKGKWQNAVFTSDKFGTQVLRLRSAFGNLSSADFDTVSFWFWRRVGRGGRLTQPCDVAGGRRVP